jgi:cobalt/nickel transport system permease protein
LASIQKSFQQIAALEELTHKHTPLHRMNAAVKLMITFIYIIIVVSFRPMELDGLLFFACFPVFLMIIGEIPLKPLMLRCMIALPFALFAGISNLFLDRTVYTLVEGVPITGGMVTFSSLLLKTVLTVMAVLLYMATTKMNDMIYALHSIHVPSLIMIQMMMTYRYIGVLMDEAMRMHHAYLLRAPKEKGIKLKDMGTFLGQLILRSIDRAERIYHAMQCRGFEGRIHYSAKKPIGAGGWLVIFMIGFLMIMVRVLLPGEMIGRIFIR